MFPNNKCLKFGNRFNEEKQRTKGMVDMTQKKQENYYYGEKMYINDFILPFAAVSTHQSN